MSKYSELYPDSLTSGSGLISQLASLDTIPFNVLSESDKVAIEQAYYVRSGFKTITSVFESAPADARSRLISALFAEKWTKLWNDFKLNYNALDSYSITENWETKKDGSKISTTTYGRVTTDEGTDTGETKMESIEALTGTNGVYGFNSSTQVPSDTSTESNTVTDTETRDLKDTRKSTNSGEDTTDDSLSDTETYTGTKKGNIGYYSPQELLEKEFNLWKTPYFNLVFTDIDSLITVGVYDI